MIFGLTESEANLAAAIARGDTPNEVAEARGISLATVRSQLASIYTKTAARRQSELVSLLARVSIRPEYELRRWNTKMAGPVIQTDDAIGDGSI